MQRFENVTIDHLIEKARSYMPYLDEALVLDAYLFAEEVHEGHFRYVNTPYIQHPLHTTYLMLDLKPDLEAILACLLHDVPLHKKDAMKAIKNRFGQDVHDLVESSRKLHMVKVRNYENQVEILRKMFMALAKDLRVVFIRLADRLHNMITLDYRPEEFRLQMAQETMDVYAPIASRLGIYQFKSQLEDLAFKHLNPEEYKSLSQEVTKYARERQEFIDDAILKLEETLKKAGFDAKVTGRAKHIHSIYNKLKKKGINDIGAIYDVHALRVVIPDKDDGEKEDFSHLYSVLGIIHSNWTPLPNRFKDYIAVPKPNGYRSLHTAIVGLIENFKKPVEIQIRTESMHEQAEYGIAAHWWYKESAKGSNKVARYEFERTLNQYKVFSKLNNILEQDLDLAQKVEKLVRDWGIMNAEEIAGVEEALLDKGFSCEDMMILEKSRSKGMLMMRHKYFHDQLEWIEGMARLKTEASKDVSERDLKLDLFKNRIFVLTPHGDVKDLPKGATPVDFAYSVHTNVGHTCAQAKVDGKIVPLDYELENGQVVEILTRKEPKPNRYWLSFVKTAVAMNRIKAWFRTFDRDHNLKEGREVLNRYLQRLSKPVLDPKLLLLKEYGGKRMTQRGREEIVESVGNGMLTVGQVLRKVFSPEELIGESENSTSEQIPDKEINDDANKVLVGGHDDLAVVLSSCCKPRYGNSIIGYVTRGKTIRIHRINCENLNGLDPDRLVHVDWKNKKPSKLYQAQISIDAEDRQGLLSDITQAVSGLDCNISGITFERNGKGGVFGRLAVEVPGYDELEKVLDKLERIFGVTGVKTVDH